MAQPTSARVRRRVAVYALVAALAMGATTYPPAAEARIPEERSEAAISSTLTRQPHRGPADLWAEIDDGSDAKPSFFQSWLATIYSKLLALKTAVGTALAYAWKLGQTKAPNTCR
jgi:hypothetical protein